MSVFTHGLEPADVLDILPADTRHVSAKSAGLNLGQIQSYLDRASGVVNAQLVRHGMSPEALDADSAQLARDAVLTYASAYSLERMGAGADQIERRLREWDKLLALLRKEPQIMGAAQDGQEAIVTKSNIPRDVRGCERSRWRTSSYRYG